MKPILRKLGQIGRYLEQTRDVVESAPMQVGEIRTAVQQTRQQLQQLRAEVLSSIMALKTDVATPVSESLGEIESAQPLLREAGYVMAAAELEMGVVQRWVVHLNRVEEVPASQIVALAKSLSAGSAAGTLLKAVVSAQQMALEMSHGTLIFTSITVYLGPNPSLRIGWESPELEPAPDGEVVPDGAPPSVSAASVSVSPASLAAGFGSSSFFESRTPVQPANPPAPPPLARPPSAPAVAPLPSEASTPAPADWRTDALTRFKKMPDLRRRG